MQIPWSCGGSEERRSSRPWCSRPRRLSTLPPGGSSGKACGRAQGKVEETADESIGNVSCSLTLAQDPAMQTLLDALAEIVGPENLLTGEAVRQRSVDWFTSAPCEAAAIVRPGNTEQ